VGAPAEGGDHAVREFMLVVGPLAQAGAHSQDTADKASRGLTGLVGNQSGGDFSPYREDKNAQ
jgi:hypothetical protein